MASSTRGKAKNTRALSGKMLRNVSWFCTSVDVLCNEQNCQNLASDREEKTQTSQAHFVIVVVDVQEAESFKSASILNLTTKGLTITREAPEALEVDLDSDVERL